MTAGRQSRYSSRSSSRRRMRVLLLCLKLSSLLIAVWCSTSTTTTRIQLVVAFPLLASVTRTRGESSTIQNNVPMNWSVIIRERRRQLPPPRSHHRQLISSTTTPTRIRLLQQQRYHDSSELEEHTTPIHNNNADDMSQEEDRTINNGNNNNNNRPQIKSRIREIRCRNLAGMTSGNYDDNYQTTNVEIVLNLDRKLAHNDHEYGNNSNNNDTPHPTPPTTDLIAITGETGSGKSLLIGRVADLVTGGKASVSMIAQHHSFSNRNSRNENDDDDDNDNNEVAMVEMVLSLQPAHTALVQRTLKRLDVDPTTIIMTPASSNANTADFKLTRVLRRNGPRNSIKSSCYLNDVPVPLKVLKAVGSPLLALVNAPAAAAALNKPGSRLYMLDTGVPSSVLLWVRQLQAAYRQCKQRRQSLEQELERLHLPVSMQNGNLQEDKDDRDLDLLRHWVNELDGFEGRIGDVRDTIIASNSALEEDDGSSMATIVGTLATTEWMDSDDGEGNGSNDSVSSGMYTLFLELLDEIKTLDGKIASAVEATTVLTSLSAPNSAYTALDRARKLLLDATNGMEDGDSKVAKSAEKTHDLLNRVEDALLQCGAFLEDKDKSLVGTLEESRRRCLLSSEDLLGYITEWNTLARKHGISPYQLPSCHLSLRRELEGGVEARVLLPKALEAERKALLELEEGCRILTNTRSTLCTRLSESITGRLPLLGMGNSRFEARLRRIGTPTYGSSHVGVDEVDFFLYHGNKGGQRGTKKENRDGKLENVASSGEKARILLAIECLLPGSVRALCGSTSDSDISFDDRSTTPPVAVIYDEIDAHVGGRASISVAQMLVDQSRSCQVLSITHSPSLAALADTHISVSKTTEKGPQPSILARSVEGIERQKELARMASGDMASAEAELFAKALLRDASMEGRWQNATAIPS